MARYGGFMRFTYAGNNLRVRAEVDTEPTSDEREAIDNQDGSYDVTVKPMGPVVEITFADSDDGDDPTSYDWNDIMSGGPYDMTLVEESRGVNHAWTQASFIGRPKVNRNKGEVKGIKIKCGRGGYSQMTTT